MRFSARQAATVWGIGCPADFEMDGAAVDSRQVRQGNLFVALRGARADGHEFIAEALARGARAALVSRVPESGANGPIFLVPDPLVALQSLASAMRRQANFRLAAVTGSAGKTTTKEMVAAIFSTKFPTGKTPGNLNSDIGFPLAVLNLEPDVEVVAGEMGMSHKGELSLLSRLFTPEAAAITNVSMAHAQNFSSLEEIGDAKWEILEGLTADGVFVFNADDPLLRRRAARLSRRKISFGLSAEAQVTATDIARHGVEGTSLTLCVEGERAETFLPLPGLFHVSNALCAAALGHAWGISAEAAAGALDGFSAPGRRGQVFRLPSGALLVDDSYNSSPAAAKAALASLAEETNARRRIAVLGDMLELGDHAPALHREVGAAAARVVDRLVCVGPLARYIGDAAQEAGLPPAAVIRLDTAAQVAGALKGDLRAGDVVWIKGSRGIQLDAAVEALRA